jgi:hypothetical protein
VLTTALLVIAALAGTGLSGVAELGRAQLPRTTVAVALAAMTGTLLAGGLVAAVALAMLPSGLIGVVGVVPFIRGLGRLTSVRFRDREPAPAATAGELARAARAGITDPAVAYLAILGTRAAPEVLLASAIVMMLGVVAGAAAPALGARTLRWRRPVAAIAGWTLLLTGGFLLVDGGAFSWLLRR